MDLNGIYLPNIAWQSRWYLWCTRWIVHVHVWSAHLLPKDVLRTRESGAKRSEWATLISSFFRSLASGLSLWTRWIHKKKCSHLKMLKCGATAFQGFRVCGRDCSCSIRESARIFWSVTSALQRECREGIFRRLNEDLAVMVGCILLSSTKPPLSWKHTLRNPFCSCLCIMRLRSFR